MQRSTSEMPISKTQGKQRFVLFNVCFEQRSRDKYYKIQKINLRTVLSHHLYVNVFIVLLLSIVLCYSN